MPIVDDSPLSGPLPFEIGVPQYATAYWRTRTFCKVWPIEFVFFWTRNGRVYDFIIPFTEIPTLEFMRSKIAEQDASAWITCTTYHSPMRLLRREIARAMDEEALDAKPAR